MDNNDEVTPISDNIDANQNEDSQDINKFRRKSDLAWEHCTLVGTRSLKCNYCMKVINGGGITRMKAHLAKRKGDISSCKKVPAHVSYQIESDMSSFQVLKRQKKGVDTEVSSSQSENLHDTIGSATPISLDKYFPPTNSGSQKTIKSVLATKKDVEAVDFMIARWMYDCCIPFNAINSPYFQKMVDAIASVGRGYKAPSYHAIRTTLLKKNVEDMNNHVDSFRRHWEMVGCTIMADGWTDSRQRTLINFLVYCPQGLIFLKFIDASEQSKTSEMLFGLFKEIIEYVGPKNVVHLVTDNASNYMAAGKLVKKQYGHIFWSPCAAHCIDLMLEKFDSLPSIHDVINDAREPLVKVLRMVDGDDRPSMGYIYEGMRKAKEEIKASFDGNEMEFQQYIDIVDDKWEGQLGHPLHSAGVFLNPSIFYKDMQISTNHRIWSGFLDAAEVMYFKDDEKIIKVTAEADMYRNAIGDFGRSQAIQSRDKLLPGIWWKSYGGSAPNLQEMAIRILSQTCSASGCERNWSVFERIHSKKRNRLAHKRLNDLVFVQCNLRLRDKHERNKMKNLEPISFEFGDSFDAWVEEPLLANEDVEDWSDLDDDVY